MAFKSHLSVWLRKLRLLGLAEQARYQLQRYKNRRGNQAFREKYPDFILPPYFFIYETYRLDLPAYYQDGKNTAGEIVDEFKKGIDIYRPGTRVLDWGCGPGRIVRHLPALLPSAEVYGTDYNKDYVDWCSKALTNIRFSLNHIDPPMPYEHSFFDAVIGISIFTHLSEKNHIAWIDELHRVIKAGGVAFLTTQGKAYRQILLEAEQVKFDANELVVREDIEEGNRLFSAFQSPGFMQHLIKGKFEVIDFVAAPAGSSSPAQDSWLLRKIT